MSIVVNRQIAGDLNKPSAELLNFCINKHVEELLRLQKLSDYYDGKHDILKFHMLQSQIKILGLF